MAKKQRHGQKQKQQKVNAAHKVARAAANATPASPDEPAAVSATKELTPSSSPEKLDTAPKGTAAAVTDSAPSGEQLGRVVGLQNLGNTCFFNSVAQVLSASAPVRERFLQPGKYGALGQGLHELLQAAYSDPHSSGNQAADVKGKKAGKGSRPGVFNPQRLHSAVLQVAPQFKGGQEQDSHELLRLLLDGLHNEEAKAARARAKGQARAAQENGMLTQHEAAPTFVQEAFGFQLASRIECDHCHHTSTTLEDFQDLSIEVPIQESGTTAGSEEHSHKGKKGKEKKAKKKAATDEAEAVEAPAMTAKQRKKQLKLAKKAVELDRKKQRRSRAASPDPEESFATNDPSEKNATATSGTGSGPSDENVDESGHEQPDSQATRAAEETSARKVAEVAEQPANPDTGVAVTASVSSSSNGESKPRTAQNYANPYGATASSSDKSDPATLLPADESEPGFSACKGAGFEDAVEGISGQPAITGVDDQYSSAKSASSTENSFDTPSSPATRPLPDSLGNGSSYRTAATGTGSFREGSSGAEDATDEHHQSDGKSEGNNSLALKNRLALASSSLQEPSSKNNMEQPLGVPKPVRLKIVKNNLGARSDHQDDIDTLYSVGGQPGSTSAEGEEPAAQEDEEEGEHMSGLGSLFDEVGDSGNYFSAMPEPSSPPSSEREAVKESSLESCLAAFFSSEVVSWECPAESQVRKGAVKKAIGHGIMTPQHTSQRSMRRSVSFAEEKPAVKLVPGSVEQRGTDFREALRGQTPFCRPLKLDDAYLLITAESDALSRNSIHVTLHPQDKTVATMAVLPESISIATVSISEIEDSDDEDEQAEVMRQAQLLMDCVADLVTHEGVDGMQAMTEGGLQLVPGLAGETWKARGKLPKQMGEGNWEYPSTTPHGGDDDSKINPSSTSYLSMSPRSQAPSTPQTPAASATSFESIDLGTPVMDDSAQMGSPVNRPASLAFIRMERNDFEAPTVLRPPKLNEPLILGGQGAKEISPALDLSPPLAHLRTVDGTSTQLDSIADTAEQHTSEYTSALPKDSDNDDAGEASSVSLVRGADASAEDVATPLASCHDAQVGKATPNSTQADCTHKARSAQADSEDGGRRGEDADACSAAHVERPLKGTLKNMLRTAHKGYQIHRCPQLLTVHLKRFHIDHRGRAQKIQGHVPFGFDLNVSSFCDAKGPDAAGARYGLLGVVVHQGSSMKTGHYFAYVHRTVSSSSIADSVAGPANQDTSTGTLNGLLDPASLGDASRSQLPKGKISNDAQPDREGNLSSEEMDHSANSLTALEPADSFNDGLGADGRLTGSCKAEMSAAVEPQVTKARSGAGSLIYGLQDPEEAENNMAYGSGLSQPRKVWYFAGDTTVRKIAFEEVLACEAYVLVYERL